MFFTCWKHDNKVLNTKGLTSYQKCDATISHDNVPTHLPITTNLKDKIEVIIDHQEVNTRTGNCHKFLVKWNRRPQTDCTWSIEADLKKLSHVMHVTVYDFNFTEPSFAYPMRTNGAQ